MVILLKFFFICRIFHKIETETEETETNSFNEATVTLTLKPHKVIIKRLQTSFPHEHS